MLRIYHSENDGMCDPDGSKTFIRKPQLKDKKLFLLDMSATLPDSEFQECIRLDMWHYLTLEPATATLRVHVTNQIKCHLDRSSRVKAPAKEANLDLSQVDFDIQAARAAEQAAMELGDCGGEDTDFDVPYDEPSSHEE
ncbi:MAG: hypothetical protein KVP17_002411 [Porospora cf. gigantea B]|nr:MAG: hypothetical protein KVP17_002411 [Porospora cf. gigantea B]